jgi:hypothetical protein
MTTPDPLNLAQRLVCGEFTDVDPRYEKVLLNWAIDLQQAPKLARLDGTVPIEPDAGIAGLTYDSGLISSRELGEIVEGVWYSLEPGECFVSRLERFLATTQAIRAAAEWPLHVEELLAKLLVGSVNDEA